MEYLDILKTLYAINGAAAILFYLPQIRNAWKNKTAMQSVSLVTFGGWSVGGAVTLLYAWSLARDPFFIAASLGGMLGATTMFGIVAAKRVKYRQTKARKAVVRRERQPWPMQQRLAFEEN